MENKRISIFIIMVISTFIFINIVPAAFISIRFSSYDVINESFSYEYVPDTPSSIEKLYLNVDVGNIEIRYVSIPVEYYVKIVLNIEMGGANVRGKLYSDYFIKQ